MKFSDFFWRTDLSDKFVLQKFLCVFLWCSREELWTNMDQEISDEIIQKVVVAYKSYIEDKKPLEYILWHVDFFGREFVVNEATLIPRPETEYMITAVREYINNLKFEAWSLKSKKNVLLDIGTGCGVLWISVLLQNPGYFGYAVLTDYFENALEVAKKNYEIYKEEILTVNSDLRVDILQSDLLQCIENWILNIDNSNVILVANLPYIPEDTFEANVADNVKKFEPKPAFVGGDDGLDYYRIMFNQTFSLLENWTLNIENFVMFLEMMTWQVDILRQEFGDKMEFEEVKTFHFNIRIVKSWLK